MEMREHACVYIGHELAAYGFGDGHPFGPQRMEAFWRELKRQNLDRNVRILNPQQASQEQIEWFHSHNYVEKVKSQSETGQGFLDGGDTPAFSGVYAAASFVVGTAIDALNTLMGGNYRRAFVPIAGLHHARRESAAGFCVFNDCAVVIESLRRQYQLKRIAYVDIDAHHGDGVFYAYEDDPDVYIADIHEDGRFLYPFTGNADETGKGEAAGSKINICLPPGANDEAFLQVWPQVEAFIHQCQPEFILLQCGADGLAGDPLTHLRLSENTHDHVARGLCRLAEMYCEGRIIGFGGGGYDNGNIARAWTTVVKAFVDAPFRRNAKH